MSVKEYFQKITLPQDKANHAMYGLVVYGIIALFDPTIAIIVVVAMGILKEVVDGDTDGTVDSWDAVATIGPALVLYCGQILVELI